MPATSDSPEVLPPPRNAPAAALRAAWLAMAAGYLVSSATGHTRVSACLACLIAAALIGVSVHRLLGAALGALLLGSWLLWPSAASAFVYFPPLFAFAFMSWFFGRTLAPGAQPLITRIARRQHADMPPEVERFTHALTLLWTLCFALLFLIAAALAFLLPVETWPRWVQALGYALPGALFLGEYFYRHKRFPERRHAPLHALIRDSASVMREAAGQSRREETGQP